MPGRISDQPDINRPPAAGDLYVLETGAGTRKMDHSRLVAAFGGGGGGGGAAASLTKVHIAATLGQTEVATPGITAAGFSAVWRGNTPQQVWLGGGAPPAGFYKVDEPGGKVIIGGSALSAGEGVLVFYDATNQWRKYYFTASGGETSFVVPSLNLATFTQVWASMTPLFEYTGGGAVPTGNYRADLAGGDIELGDAALAGQLFFVMFKA